MKIIIVSPSLNFLGGAQRVCLHAIHALRRTNCQLVLATIDKTNWALVESVFGESSKPDKELYLFSRMPEMPTLALRQAFVALSYAFSLFLIALKNKGDLIINLGGEIADNRGDVIYVNAIPLRFTYLLREIQPKQGFQWRVYGRLYSALLTILGGTAGTIITNSKFNQTIIEKCLRKKPLVINPPVMSSKIKSESNHRDRIDTIVTITRFRSAKGLAIIPQIAVFLKNCNFVLIGATDSGSESCLKELSEEIERLQVGDRVQIFKNKPYSFTLSALSTAKVFLQTQSTEAFGMSVVESMAAGCVPVVPRAGGPWIDILDRQEGLYGFSYKNPREAANKIELLISNESLRGEISTRAVKRALIYDSSVFESKFLNVVETISYAKSGRSDK